MDKNYVIDWELIKIITPIIVGIFSIFGVIVGYLSYKKKKNKGKIEPISTITGDNINADSTSINISGIGHKPKITFNKKISK